jgi:trehalose/maltose transport system substrate-binding protein
MVTSMKHVLLVGAVALALAFGHVSAQTITVAAGAVGQELELARAAADRYMAANPGVTVRILDTPDLADDRLGLYLQFFQAQSTQVDVYQIDVIWPGDLAVHFVDLYEYGARDVVGAHFPAIVENNTVDGRLIAIPWFTDAGLLYFRTDLLEKYGFAGPPATWSELTAMAQTIQDGERAAGNADFWGFVWQGNSYEGLTCDALEWVASNAGGSIISPNAVITINNPNAIAVIDQAAAWVGTISPPGVTGFGEEDARNLWQAGNAAFMRNWPYAYSLGNMAGSAVAGRFDVSPLPAGDAEGGTPAATLGGWQLGVSRYSQNPALAADVALFLASYDEQKVRAVQGSLNPTIMALYEDADVLAAVPFFGSLYDVFINAVARPSTATAPNYAQVSSAFFRAVHSVLTGAEDAETALALLELDLVALTGFPTE